MNLYMLYIYVFSVREILFNYFLLLVYLVLYVIIWLGIEFVFMNVVLFSFVKRSYNYVKWKGC